MGKKIAILVSLVIVALTVFLYNMLTWSKNVFEDKIVSPSQVNSKLKDAIIGSGSIELTAGEVNSLIDSLLKDNEKYKDSIKEAYINIVGDKVEINAVYHAYNHDWFISSVIRPGMVKGNVNVAIEKISVGRISIPKGLVLYFAKKALPASASVLADNSIDLGPKILIFDIKSVMVADNKIKIQLNDDGTRLANNIDNMKTGNTAVPNLPAEKTTTSSTTTPIQSTVPVKPAANSSGSSNSNKNETTKTTATTSTTTTTQTVSEQTKQKIEMLRKTNGQLYGVLNAVKSESGKSWVQSVISVNSRMIENPDANYSGDINSAKAVYKSLPANVRSEVKNAAISNLDAAAVRYLVTVYGI